MFSIRIESAIIPVSSWINFLRPALFTHSPCIQLNLARITFIAQEGSSYNCLNFARSRPDSNMPTNRVSPRYILGSGSCNAPGDCVTKRQIVSTSLKYYTTRTIPSIGLLDMRTQRAWSSQTCVLTRRVNLLTCRTAWIRPPSQRTRKDQQQSKFIKGSDAPVGLTAPPSSISIKSCAYIWSIL